MTILIVDDARESQATLEVTLEQMGSVASVATAEHALQRLAQRDITAIVTDVQLPAMDGWQLVAAIRADPAHATLPIIVVSASPDPDAPAKALLAGANAYFTKPFSPLAVRRRLQELLEESIHAH